ncbi:MAG: TIGR00366 family protein [Caulobacterales bacterium]|nr:TIGR00366 family protein [Caulobacterales bacterium]
MSLLKQAVRPFATFVERYYPDPLVFAVALTAIAFALAIGLTEATPIDALAAWGGGLSALMAFIGQVAIMLVVAHALAHTGPVRAGLSSLAQLPTKAWHAYVLVAFVSGLASLFAWSFGIVGGAIIARRVAIETDRKGVGVHYPLLVASAYAGFSIWHMGYSGSAPLFVATPGHILEDAVGVIPVTETMLAPWNIAAAAAALAVICVICPLMHPRAEDVAPVERAAVEEADAAEQETAEAPPTTPAERIERLRVITFGLGAALAGYLVWWFATEGLRIDLNIVVWTLLALCCLFARSPIHLVRLIGEASGVVGPVLLQFPLYAGIMGLMTGTGLAAVIAGGFAALASPHTLTFWAFLSGGIINFFVPSGGGQWVVQGPIFIEAAQRLGVEPARIVMGVAYGDQWTNLAQPFWALPLLAIAGLRVRDILGYCFIVLIALFFVFSGALFLIGPGEAGATP